MDGAGRIEPNSNSQVLELDQTKEMNCAAEVTRCGLSETRYYELIFICVSPSWKVPMVWRRASQPLKFSD
jgi:hypothetical protein